MSVIYVLLPLALILGGIALYAFIKSVKGGQFDDLETPPLRMLTDDEEVRAPAKREAPPVSTSDVEVTDGRQIPKE